MFQLLKIFFSLLDQNKEPGWAHPLGSQSGTSWSGVEVPSHCATLHILLYISLEIKTEENPNFKMIKHSMEGESSLSYYEGHYNISWE